MFVDKVKVNLHAGKGGNGKLSFRHEKYIERGGPDGGDGGNGGDIVALASNNQNSLANFRYKKLVSAENGDSGEKRKKHGKQGKNLTIKLPVGTIIYAENGEILADLVKQGQSETIAKGGKGGFGNAHFISSTRQAPRIAELGEPGEEFEVTFELKILADVGLIGLPNAGKSTLLSKISNARPEIADYPFTTLSPNLGVVDIDKETSILVADIPGLIEGASKGKGLGVEFLRHIERTKLLVHLIDAYQTDIAMAYQTIVKELEAYSKDLSRRPQIVALNKIEGLDKEISSEQIKFVKQSARRGTKILAISAASGQGVKELLFEIKNQLAKVKLKSRKLAKPEIPVISLKSTDDYWKVKKKGKNFVVHGQKIERFAHRTDFGSYDGVSRMKDIMRKMGIMHELERKGIKIEDNIVIGEKAIGKFKY